ncbi:MULTISPECIES: hypothetical protein [unclassified Variovorax]|uniref:hypothetical protein n=1 Tax=unclassified Variovorax TaxID=663243 RepID=UPI003ED15DFC
MFKNNILHESVHALVEELIPKFYLTSEMSDKRCIEMKKQQAQRLPGRFDTLKGRFSDALP